MSDASIARRFGGSGKADAGMAMLRSASGSMTMPARVPKTDLKTMLEEQRLQAQLAPAPRRGPLASVAE